eukprot:GEZU01029532.1.p1 GENE.GEZU01029532.1~~GEZU01029532.1.p1  ORF type:complete len:184 (+),score=18.18 GEZU01029532.1:67-618(+)
MGAGGSTSIGGKAGVKAGTTAGASIGMTSSAVVSSEYELRQRVVASSSLGGHFSRSVLTIQTSVKQDSAILLAGGLGSIRAISDGRGGVLIKKGETILMNLNNCAEPASANTQALNGSSFSAPLTDVEAFGGIVVKQGNDILLSIDTTHCYTVALSSIYSHLLIMCSNNTTFVLHFAKITCIN